MSDSIIPALKHRFPSHALTNSCLGESSTRMGDLLGSPRVAFLFFFIASRDDGVWAKEYFIFIVFDGRWSFYAVVNRGFALGELRGVESQRMELEGKA